jgi:hypothetical protein
MFPNQRSRSRSDWVANIRSIFVGFGFFFLGGISDVWLQQHTRSHSIAITTDAALGIAAGLLVLFYERRRKQNLLKHLEVIRLMNHHVRNSLQVISFVSSAPQQEELIVDVRDAVERIEWALREILPGRRKDMENLLFHEQR